MSFDYHVLAKNCSYFDKDVDEKPYVLNNRYASWLPSKIVTYSNAPNNFRKRKFKKKTPHSLQKRFARMDRIQYMASTQEFGLELRCASCVLLKV